MSLRFLVFSLFLLIVACGPRQSAPIQGSYDVDAFLNSQISLLTQRRVTLHKHAVVNGMGSDSMLLPSQVRWSEELEIFRQFNLIRSTLYGTTYERDNALDDPQSNLKIERYRSATAPLRELRIYYLDNLSHILRMDGEVVEDNPMYSAGRTLVLDVEENGGQLMLTSYSVVGYQKLALRDTASYRITGMLRW